MKNLEINEIEVLDNLLLKTLLYLFKNWYRKDVGIVACCIKDQDKLAFATSFRNDIAWTHAERNAYNRFRRIHGEPSDHAIFIITLSPCIKKLKYRKESSCSELMKSLGVKRSHFGILDSMHAESIDDYSDFGFVATLANDIRIKSMCQKLMDMFKFYDSKINSELSLIKKNLGDAFFSPIVSGCKDDKKKP